MSTLTLFLHGTRYHQKGKVKSVVTALAEASSGEAYVVHGPGGVTKIAGAHAGMPGTYKVDKETGEKIPQSRILTSKMTRLIAAATGWGVDHNLVEMLVHVERQSPLPTTINLLGYSRGADACLRFANLMYEFYPQITLNIMAIEPVPGPGRHSAAPAQIIPPNVKQYFSTLALHEGSALFRPHDYSSLKPQNFEATHIECLPLPGHHGVHAKLAEKRPETDDVSELVHDIAIEKLKEWGTTFRLDPPYPIRPKKQDEPSYYEPRTDSHPEGLLTKYATIMMDIKNYGAFSKVRYLARHREDYSPILPNCFINQHHLKLFAKTFPVTYRYMLNPTVRMKENSNTELQQYPRIQEWLSTTFESQSEKTPIYFDLQKDRMDGNLLRVTMAVHAFRKNPLVRQKEKLDARTLLKDCQNILTRPYSDKEAEIKLRVDNFCQKHPSSKLTSLLHDRFMAKEQPLHERMCHELKAATNQNLLKKLIEKIESVLSPQREAYYQSVKNSLSHAIDTISTKPMPSKNHIVKILQQSLHNIKYQREKTGITRESSTEKTLAHLITHTKHAPELTPTADNMSQPPTNSQYS